LAKKVVGHFSRASAQLGPLLFASLLARLLLRSVLSGPGRLIAVDRLGVRLRLLAGAELLDLRLQAFGRDVLLAGQRLVDLRFHVLRRESIDLRFHVLRRESIDCNAMCLLQAVQAAV